MKQFRNTRDVHLMIWETNPLKKAKKECQTNINVPVGTQLNVGDRVYVGELG